MILTVLALLAAAQPDRWVHLGGSAGVHEDYLDKDSIAKKGGKVALWTRRDLVRDEATLWYEIQLDCVGRTQTIVAWIRDDRGTVSHSVDRPHRAAAPIKAGSLEEKVFSLACR